MGSDARDEDSPAPLPPHERTWRHPSEMGSWEHDISTQLSSPPPLSRRTTTIVALLSAACSVAVIATAIPRVSRSDNNSASQFQATPTTEFLKTAKEALSHSFVQVGRDKSLGLALVINGESIVVSSSKAIPASGNSEVVITADNGESSTAVVVARDSESGFVILKGQDAAQKLPTGAVVKATTPSVQGDRLLVFNPTSSGMKVVRRGISLDANGRLIPLDMADALRGIAAVSDGTGSIIGVAIERNHTTWLIPINVITELISRVRGE